MNKYLVFIIVFIIIIFVNNSNCKNSSSFKISKNVYQHLINQNNNNNNNNNNNKNNSSNNNNSSVNDSSNNDSNSKGSEYIVGNDFKLWVFFNSKNQQDQDILKENQYHRIKEITNIKEDSIRRRKKRSVNNNSNNNNNNNKNSNIIDSLDLPVSNQYINSILNCNNNSKESIIQLKLKSKWLNSISISIKSTSISTIYEILECISNKSFVDHIDLVSKFKKDRNRIIDKQVNINNKNNNNNNNNLILNNLNSNNLINNIDYNSLFYGKSYNSIKQVDIDQLQTLGPYDGKDINILILDSGFNKSHKVFKTMNIIAEHNFVDNIQDTGNSYGDDYDDSVSHGTATLSVLGAYNPGVLVGAAYNANYLLAKTEDVRQETQVEEDYFIAAIEWGEGLGADLLSASLGYFGWIQYTDMNGKSNRITKVADIAVTKGMVCIISAGNSGKDGISEPADGVNIIAVGAVSADGVITSFSSLGPSSDGRIKPDVVALGKSNYVADSRGFDLYYQASGTSFSCPLVASGVALLLQARPSWSSMQIVEAIRSSGSQINSPDIVYGFGLFSAIKAYNYQPISQNCSINQCSGHGGCCNNECTCAINSYGQFCQYPKVSCSFECNYRGGVCQANMAGYSFVCVSNSSNQLTDLYDPRGTCSVCSSSFNECGICGGLKNCTDKINSSDGSYWYPSSNSNNNNSNSKRNSIIIGIVVGVVGSLILVSVFIFFKRYHFTKKNSNNKIELN